MNITPDQSILWQWEWLHINETMVFTWVVMFVLVGGSWIITRKLTIEAEIPRWQNLLEVIVTTINDQISDASGKDSSRYLPFIGTLFLYILSSNLLENIPGFVAPTGSLSTTTALAISVFVAVPLFGIANDGIGGYLKQYIQPTILMMPFNIIGELTRTISLAVRLYGNIMSGTVIVGILLSLTPFFFPLVMQLLGLITGTVQAYIFAMLAMVYIASATAAHDKTRASAINKTKNSDEPNKPSESDIKPESNPN
ncbi:F0F1 ATP synthase subunit A [Cocleimonas flava]|uniref:ATP synthase subunit a n=1 Tax=Cocleimonas flava TaxID=634765 RepID=A0A4R1F9W6_9GAMM|nr:F0F1 ATP synthase subunit A [Cocleimonas flava]TCJ87601.1 ATP synthase F0 subcomplex A subunit [Cocleimonas flava]